MPLWAVTFRVFFAVSSPTPNFLATLSASMGVCLSAVTGFDGNGRSKVWLSSAVETLERIACGSEGSTVSSTACWFMLQAVKGMPFLVATAAISMALLLGREDSHNRTVDGFHSVGPMTWCINCSTSSWVGAMDSK